MLLEMGADPNIVNSLGQTALFYCVAHDKEGQCRILLKHSGINLTIRD